MNIEAKIGIVIVSYKNPTMTTNYIRKEVSKLKEDFFLVVVNVSSTEKESKQLAKDCGIYFAGKGLEQIKGCSKEDRYFLIWTPDNLGYAKGNNLGVNFLVKIGAIIDYFLFSNDDIEILDANILSYLINKAEKDENIAGIGPRIICIDGAEGSPQNKYFSPWHIMAEYFIKSLRGERQKTIAGIPNANAPVEGKTYWVSGAFMLIKANWFKKVDGFDERTFLYYEEPILAERFKRCGGYFYYAPKVKILHYEGGSSKKQIKNRTKQNIIEDSRILYYKEYINISPITLFIYKAFCRIKNITHKIIHK